MKTTGFIDLRLGNERQNEEGFWPSFTDIMTVIVIIFLLAMLTLLLKNMDLVQQLRTSLEAERSASSQAQSTSDKNLKLGRQVLLLQKEAAATRSRMQEMDKKQQQTQAELKSSRNENSRLASSNKKLLKAKLNLLANNAAISNQIESLKQKQAALLDELAKSNASFKLLEQQLQSKAIAQKQTLAELTTSRNENIRLTARNEKLAKTSATLLAGNADLKKQIESLRQKQAGMIDDLAQRSAEFRLLEEQYQSKTAEQKQTQARLEASKSENSRLASSNKKLLEAKLNLLANNAAISNQIESLKQKQAALLDELAKSNASFKLLEQQLQSKAIAQKQTLAELTTSRNENIRLTARNEKLAKTSATLLAGNADLKKQIESLRQKQAGMIDDLAQRSAEFKLLEQQYQSKTAEQKQTQARLEASKSENSRLASSNKKLLEAKLNLLANNAAISNQIESLKQKQAALLDELTRRNSAFDLLSRQFQNKAEEAARLLAEQEEKLNRIRKLKLEYANLEKKYKYLIRPARSAKGRYVVFVRYQKINDKLNIEIKSQDESEYSPVSGAAMHKRLAELQSKHPKDLYVRIVFPNDSGLSYTEAWNLTESLLRMYDYYYQKPE